MVIQWRITTPTCRGQICTKILEKTPKSYLFAIATPAFVCEVPTEFAF